MDLQSMPVDILEHILLRLDSPSCLVRASCTCKQWRRIIAGPVFLRRIRSLHEPPVAAGSYQNPKSIRPCPRFEPSSVSPAAIGGKYLSLDFLPENRSYNWSVVDSCGSLLLLNLDFTKNGIQHQYMFVCEPFTKRYEKVVPLAASPHKRKEAEAFLLAGAGPGATDRKNFRIVYLSRRDGVVGIFTSGGEWRKLNIGNRGKKMVCMGLAAGSMYWYTNAGKVYALDTSTATFSSSSLPDVEDIGQLMIFSKFAVTTGRDDGKARIVFLGAGNNLKIFAKPKSGRNWVLEKTVQLSAEVLGVSSNMKLYLDRSVPVSAERVVGSVRIVASTGQIIVSDAVSLDIDTMQVERTTEFQEFPVKLPWPKSLHALY